MGGSAYHTPAIVGKKASACAPQTQAKCSEWCFDAAVLSKSLGWDAFAFLCTFPVHVLWTSHVTCLSTVVLQLRARFLPAGCSPVSSGGYVLITCKPLISYELDTF